MNSIAYHSLSREAVPLLSDLELQDPHRAAAFEISASNVNSIVQTRLELFQTIRSDFVQLCQAQQLDSIPYQTLWQVWLPLGLQIADWHRAKNAPLIQGFLGGQGAGKTTLTAVLTLILRQLGYTAASLSLDDLYLPYCDRQQLQTLDPRLIHRGPPGTHDVALGIQTLQALLAQHFPVAVPQFDKSAYEGAGDRTAPKLIHQADIVLFEGWFVGTRPLETSFATAPAPILDDRDRQFAQDMNQRLRQYLPLWALLDRLIVLYVPNYRLSQQWRKEAEHKMIAQGKPGMSDAAIDTFVEYFWKALHPELFITPLTQAGADLVIEIGSDHSPSRIYAPPIGAAEW
jgi:D-glycerate 3-kinase